jgi:hypothetical protein
MKSGCSDTTYLEGCSFLFLDEKKRTKEKSSPPAEGRAA